MRNYERQRGNTTTETEKRVTISITLISNITLSFKVMITVEMQYSTLMFHSYYTERMICVCVFSVGSDPSECV